MNFKKNLSAGSLLLAALIYIIIGIFVFIQAENIIIILPKLIGAVFIGIAFIQLFAYIKKRKIQEKKPIYLIEYIAALFVGLFALSSSEAFISLLPVFVAVYMFFLAFIYVIIICQYYSMKESFIVPVLKFLFYFSLAMFLILTNKYENAHIITRVIGVFLIFNGLTYFLDFSRELNPAPLPKKIRRRIRYSPPVLLTALMPRRMLAQINKFFRNEQEEGGKYDLSDEMENTENPDLEIFIHVREKGTGMLGHMDIYFDGYVLSYGNYDESSYRLFTTIGDGTIFATPNKNEYIKLCNENYQKTIFSFGLKLTSEQIKRVRLRINEIYQDTYPWLPPILYYKDSPKHNEFTDYASELYEHTKAKFRKYKTGVFKQYFSLNTNCVLLADSVIGQTGIDIVNLNGIITPGAYYDYLEREYHRKNSIVITKQAYNPKGIIR